ncbi:MAG TPA: alpha/beta fold hydrolase [Dehalococcoidia bacterium]|nr:alpha/beta fold hydrolase [Dehalococcoidia bacterium]
MPHIAANGIQLNYREAGQGPTVLLVHGFTGNLRNWALQIPVLTREFRTVSLDLRGHGHSDKPTGPEDYAVTLMAEDVYQLVRALDLSPCYLIGHSMGGMIAQHLILAHPEPFQALVLVDTAAEMPDGMRTQERARLMEIAREQGMEAVFEEQLKMNPLSGQLRQQYPGFLDTWRQQFLLTSREAYLYCAQGMATRKPLLDKLPAIEVPTLIVCGENDQPFVGPSHRMHERIPGSELAIIAGAGHTPQMEKTAEFNRVLMGFLNRVSKSVAVAEPGT